MTRLLTVEVRHEQDVVLARQRARQVAMLLGFDSRDQIRIATAVSEIARNALQHVGSGTVRLHWSDDRQELTVTVHDQGPGIKDVQGTLDGRYVDAQSGVGIASARRVMDRFEIESTPAGTTVTLAKSLPKKSPRVTLAHLGQLAAKLTQAEPESVYEEFQVHNQELLRTLAELRKNQAELAEVNRELEETNRGVVALYAELEETAESLRNVVEQKSRFYSNMSHEFRTPINSILSLSRILLDRLDGDLTDEQQRQVELVRKSAQNLLDWVNDLLDLAKTEAGKMAVRPARFEVGNLFSSLRGMLKPLLHNNRVALIFEEARGLEPAYTDEGKVSQILRNFVTNALKFTEQGEIRVSATRGDGDTLRFAVRDTGIGIAPEDQARIFDEFVQIEGSQKGVQGTGLGLALSKRFTELLGGRLMLESEPGRGSTFAIEVPRVLSGCKPEPTDPNQNPQPLPEGTPTPPSRPDVLVIDDDEASRYVLRTVLGQESLTVLESSDGTEGLQRAKAEQPRVIFLDLSMPGMNGFDALNALKADAATKEIPVIIHSSRPLSWDDRRRLEAAHTIVHKVAIAADHAGQITAALQSAGVIIHRP